MGDHAQGVRCARCSREIVTCRERETSITAPVVPMTTDARQAHCCACGEACVLYWEQLPPSTVFPWTMKNGANWKNDKAQMSQNAEHVSSSSVLKGTRCIVERYDLHATSHCARGVPERGNKADSVRAPYYDRGDGPASQNRHGGCCVPNRA